MHGKNTPPYNSYSQNTLDKNTRPHIYTTHILHTSNTLSTRVHINY